MEGFESLIELVSHFDTEEKCLRYLEVERWRDKPVSCPHCKHEKVYRFADGKRFKCASCRKQFTVRTGTIFEDSKISLRKWLVAIFLVTSHKKGISSHQLARDVQVTQKTAWFMLHRIRFGLGGDNDPHEELSDTVEVDETFVGGKNRNRHRDKKVQNSQGRSFKDKTPILGLMQREGKVKTIVIPSTSGQFIQPLVRQIVADGANLMTDEWQAYQGLGAYYNHRIVNHSQGQYGDGLVHTNTIEGFWPWIKRMIMGVYHSTSRKHLQFTPTRLRFGTTPVN